MARLDRVHEARFPEAPVAIVTCIPARPCGRDATPPGCLAPTSFLSWRLRKLRAATEQTSVALTVAAHTPPAACHCHRSPPGRGARVARGGVCAALGGDAGGRDPGLPALLLAGRDQPDLPAPPHPIAVDLFTVKWAVKNYLRTR